MAKIIEQIALKPGRYKSGVDAQGKPQFYTLTREDIAKHVAGTSKMMQAGYLPPVILSHPKKSTKDGAPRTKADIEAEKVRNGSGWLKEITQNSEGEMVYKLGVTDSEVGRKLEEGSIKFTSPELRPSWTDGKGNKFEHVVSHVALTHKPINIDQSAIAEPVAMQFSLDDWQQFGDDETDDDADEFEAVEEAEAESEPEPDMPEKPDANRSQRIAAIIAHLAEMEITLPEDTANAEVDVLLDRLLTALMTAGAHKKAAAEKEAETDDTPPPVVEQRGVMQYSLDDVSDDGFENKLLAKVIRGEHKKLADQLDKMVLVSKITPAAKDAILALDGAMQFSTDGDFVPALSISEVVGILDQSLPEGMHVDAMQFSVGEHPDGDKFYREGDALATEDEAKAINDQHTKKLPGMFRKPQAASA